MFSKLIVQLLQDKKISAYKLSQDTDISQTLISQWKSGRQEPAADKLKILSDYFNVSIDYLLGKTDKKEKPQYELELSSAETEFILAFRNATPELKEAFKTMLKDKYGYNEGHE